MNEIYDNNQLQERQNTPLVLPSSEIANFDVFDDTKLNCHVRSGNTSSNTRPNVGKHSIFVR